MGLEVYNFTCFPSLCQFSASKPHMELTIPHNVKGETLMKLHFGNSQQVLPCMLCKSVPLVAVDPRRLLLKTTAMSPSWMSRTGNFETKSHEGCVGV